MSYGCNDISIQISFSLHNIHDFVICPTVEEITNRGRTFCERNVFGGSIITQYVYVLQLISYKTRLFSWMFAYPILIICFKYKCMCWHEHQVNRYPATRNSASPPETFTQQLNTPGTVTILQGGCNLITCTRVCRSGLSVSLYIQHQDLRVSAYITVFNWAC